MFAYILLLICVGALALAKKRFLKLSLPLIRRDDPKPLKLHVANLALSADFDLFAKGLSSWTFNGSDVATLADRYKKSAGCVFVMGPTKVGKSFFINQLLGRDDAARSHEVHNTKGETYLIQERLDAPPIIIVDTEGFFQPIDERNPLITQDFVTEHCKYMANILVLVVNAMNTHDLALFQRIVRFFVTSPITNLYCIHNVRGINTEEALEKYIRDVKDYLRTDNDREPDRNMPSNFGRFGFVQPVDGLSAAARDREQQHRLNGAAARRVDRESNKAVFHLFMGNKKSLPDIVRQQVDHVKNTIRQPFVPRREFQDATQHAVKNLMLKYYAERDFNQADVIVEGTEVRLRKDLRLQPRQQFLQYNLVNLVNSDAYYGDPRPFSMKLGDGNSINLQESPIFIDCAGLDGKSLAVQFVDERTLQIVGKKTRYDQEPPRTMDVLEQLTLPWPLIGGELGVRRVMETRGNNEMGVAHFCVLLAA